MKKKVLCLLFLCMLILTSPAIVGAVNAAFLQFESSTTTVGVGETINIPVAVDAAGDKITSVDAYVTYDSSLLQAQSVTDGTFFPTVFNDITSQRVYVAGMVNDPSTFKENKGTVATISFKALKEGTATLAYKCNTGETETSKIIKNDFDATNIIECDKNGTLSLTIGAGTGAVTTTTATPEALPQSGAFENLGSWAGLGGMLVVMGFVLRILL